MSNKLKPCPFCGSSRVEIMPDTIDDEGTTMKQYFAMCLDCVNCGVNADTEDEAIAGWNKRPTKAYTEDVPIGTLKPCPFCGGEANVKNGAVCCEPDDYWIRCQEYDAETAIYATPAEAIAAWNRRPGDD